MLGYFCVRIYTGYTQHWLKRDDKQVIRSYADRV